MESGVDNIQTELGEEFNKLMMSDTGGNYFTTLLELPPNQAMELLITDQDAPPNVKTEPVDNGSGQGSDDPSAFSESDKVPLKRKDRQLNKGKNSSKKSKTTPVLEDGEKLPYVHVRARRGQATDSHSLAERVLDTSTRNSNDTTKATKNDSKKPHDPTKERRP